MPAPQNLGVLHRTKGDTEQAEALFSEVYQKRVVALGLNHPDTEKSRVALIERLKASGKFDQIQLIKNQASGIVVEKTEP